MTRRLAIITLLSLAMLFTLSAEASGWNALTAVLTRHHAVNHPSVQGPQAVADAYSVARGQTLTVAASKGVLANDSDPSGKSLSATVATKPAHGTLALNADGGFSYTNDGSSTAADSFTYTASNGTLVSAPATVTITVTENAPVASSDSYNMTQGQSLSVPAPGVLLNDTLNGASVASYGATGVEQSAIGSATATGRGGSIVLGADGSFTYTPASNFSGTDTFQYTLRNSAGSSSASVSIAVQAQQAISITVTSPGFFFAFTGFPGQNPQLTLTRGRTYTFEVSTAAIHPFEITGAPPGSVTNNNISDGTLTFVVPTTAANYGYVCPIHGFGGTIVTVP